MALILRDYQEAAIDSIFSYFKNRIGNPLLVLPTGSGKSLLISEFVKRTFELWPGQRVVCLSHVMEILDQNHAEFCDRWGMLAPVGIYSAGIGRRDTDDPLIFAGIQSVYDKPEILGRFDLVIIDEAHLVPKVGEGRYRQYLSALKEMNNHVKVIGFTATPFRLQGGLLHRGKGRIYTDICYSVPLVKLIKEGYLAPIIAKDPATKINTSQVGKGMGDFKVGELEEAAMDAECVRLAIAEIVAYAKVENRKHWLIFACGVSHAHELVAELRDVHNVETRIILGTTPKDERDTIIREAKAGKITALVNMGVLTTGFNWPRCDLLGVLRPTQSTALYIQMYGRGMRTFEGKTNCLALDYGDNVMRHGPVNDIQVTDLGLKEEGEPKARVCPKCKAISKPRAPVCENPECGFIFPIQKRGRNLKDSASTDDPIVFGAPNFEPSKPKVVDVWSIDYNYHRPRDPDKPRPSLRVTYRTQFQQFSEWICLEHGGLALRSAEKWWRTRGSNPVPETVSEAVERVGELKEPTAIAVIQEEKYPRIVNHYFAVEKPEGQW